MKRIKRKIYLERLKSRMPGVVPSVSGNNEDITTFTFKKGKKISLDEETRETNYGMYASDMDISSTPLSGMGSIVTYRNVCDWYHSLEDFLNKLTVDTTCGTREYLDAEEYNSYEEFELSQDEVENFNKMGGRSSYEWLSNNVFLNFKIPSEYESAWHTKKLYLQEFAKWFGWFTSRHKKYIDIHSVEECVSSTTCCDCEKFFRLGGHDMYSKMAIWFRNIDITDKYIETSSITFNSTELFINDDFKYYDYTTSEYKTPSEDLNVKVIPFHSDIVIQVPLSNEVDDLGEMTALAEEWEYLVDYAQKTDKYIESGVSYNGPVVLYNGRDWVLAQSGKTGYYYSTKFKEGYFGNVSGMTDEEKLYFSFTKNSLSPQDTSVHWNRHFNRFLSRHRDQFLKGDINFYTYKNNVLVTDPTPLIMSDEYDIIHSENGFVIVKGELYEIENISYIEVYDEKEKKNKIYIVYFLDDVPMVNIRNAVKSGVFSDGKWWFDLDPNKCDGYDGLTQILSGTALVYENNVYFVNGKEFVTIRSNTNNTMSYEIFYDYANVNNRIVPFKDLKPSKYALEAYVSDDEDASTSKMILVNDEYVFGRLEQNASGIVYSTDVKYKNTVGYYIEDNKLYLQYPYEVYNANIVKGVTESKLTEFEPMNIASDDMGNRLPGFFVLDHTLDTDEDGFAFAQPKEGEMIDLCYTPGTVRNLSFVELETSYGENDECKIISISASPSAFTTTLEMQIEDVSNSTWESLFSVTREEPIDIDDSATSERPSWDTFDNTEDVEYSDIFWGDILSSMEFHIDDEYGNKVMSVLMDTNKYDFVGSGISYNIVEKKYFTTTEPSWEIVPSLSSNTPIYAIDYLKQTVEEYKEENPEELYKNHGYVDTSNIKCDFEYFLGAILTREYSAVTNSEGEEYNIYGPYKVSFLDDGADFEDIVSLPYYERIRRNYQWSPTHKHYHNHHNYGVRYKETCDLVLKEFPYALNDYYNYNILYYDVVEPKTYTDYYGQSIEKNVSEFTTNITSYVLSGSPISFVYNDDSFVDDNGFLTVPVFREEYRLGVSSIENKEGDIYINRGDAQSIDRHIKLMSCKSFNALERYGNGTFKITDK